MKSISNPGPLAAWIFTLVLLVLWLTMGLSGRPIGDYGVETDFYGDIAVHANHWLSGNPTAFSGYRGPISYLLTMALGWLIGDLFIAGKVLSAIAAAVSLLLTGRLVARLWGRDVALPCMLFMAANPIFVTHTFRACTDLLYFALFIAALDALFSSSGRFRFWALAGLLAGVAALTRYSGVGLVACAVMIGIGLERPMTRAIRGLAMFTGSFILVVLPWSVFLAIKTGDPFWTSSFQNIAISVYASDPGLAVNGGFVTEIGFTSIAEVIRVAPGWVLTTIAENAVHHFGSDIHDLVGVAWSVAALLGGISTAAMCRRKGGSNTSGRLVFLLCGLVVYLSLAPVFYNPRFMISLFPFWGVGVGLLARNVGRVAERHGHGATGRIAVAVILVFMVVSTHYREVRRSTTLLGDAPLPTAILEIAELASHSNYEFGPDTPIAARKPHIGYYLHAPVVQFDGRAIDELAQSGARYFLVTGAEVARWPFLWKLMLALDVPDGLEVVAHVRDVGNVGLEQSGTLYKLPAPRGDRVGDAFRHPHQELLIPGLDRIDSLRLRIARWFHVFDASRSSEPLLRTIEDQQHREVLTAWGDLAFLQGDRSRALGFYTRALPDSTAAPGTRSPGTDNYLRLAAVYFLDGAVVEFEMALASYYRHQGVSQDATMETFWSLYRRLENRLDRVAALGLIMAGYTFDPESPVLTKFCGKLLMLTGWHEESVPLLHDYLASCPDDEEVADMLTSLPQRRREVMNR